MSLSEVINLFELGGNLRSIRPYGRSHINETYLIETLGENGSSRYILQKVNTDVFPKVEKIMENVVRITTYLSEKVREHGGNPDREVLHVVPTKDGKNCCHLEGRGYYRMYRFIDGASRLETARSPEDFHEGAFAYGNFQSMLIDFPTDALYETIPDLHNIKQSIERLYQAADEDRLFRLASAAKEWDQIMRHKDNVEALETAICHQHLPVRVTHNNIRLNNVLLDNESGKGLCVINLDAVMPGILPYDFGDALRFGANTAAEDETNRKKVSFDLHLYQMELWGYLEGCDGSITKKEILLLPRGVLVVTFEHAVRYLTDYLFGDRYFTAAYEEHNLDRCRNQLELLKDIESKWESLIRITMHMVRQYA